MRQKAFTIVELLIVIAILLIMASIALVNARGIIQEQKISNNYNELTSILEGMRNSALTNQNSQTLGLRVEFTLTNSDEPTNMQQNEIKPGLNPNTTISSQLDSTKNYLTQGLRVSVEKQEENTRNNPTIPCNSSASIMFESQTGKVLFSCDSADFAPNPLITQLKIGLTDINTPARTRFFTIHRAAGIPQPVIQ